MANRVWKGGSGDWSAPARWTTAGTGAAGAPIPGDAALLASGDATLVGAKGQNGYLYEGVALTLGEAGGDAAALDLSDAYLGSFFSIDAGGSATIAARGASAIAGTVADSVPGSVLTLSGDATNPNGLLLVNGAGVAASGGATLKLEGLVTDEGGAKLDVSSGSTLENDGDLRISNATVDVGGRLTGRGTISLEDGSTIEVDGAVAAGQAIAFAGLGAELHVEDPRDFAGTVEDFRAGDGIDFTGPNAAKATAATYDAGAKTLTLADASGATLVQLRGVQAAAGPLSVSQDKGKDPGVTVGYADALPSAQYTISEGDRAMRSDVVRGTMTVPGTATPITGAGVKVGIISTGFDNDGGANLAAQQGFLPAKSDGEDPPMTVSAVTVLGEDTSDDEEGRAMAELVHQVAPGAQLYFAAGSTEAEYEKAVRDLTAAGCNIITDDILFPDEPTYQLASHLDAVVGGAVSRGVNVFTAAGNYGQSYLEQPFTPDMAGAEVFDNGTTTETATAPAHQSGRIELQWTAPFEGVDGAGAPTALTLSVHDAATGTLVGTATREDSVEAANVSVMLPMESVATDYDITVTSAGGQDKPATFKLFLSGSGQTGVGRAGYFHDVQAGLGSGDERGQELIPAVNTVGASDFANSAAFAGAPSYVEHFSSQGPGTLLYDAAGHALPAPRSAGKVDFTAPDEVDTAVTGFAPFSGTSAASPDAAAVAALMLQADPDLTTAQVTALLERSAIDGGRPAAQQGAGFIQADRAVALAIAALPPSLGSSPPRGPSPEPTPEPTPAPEPSPTPGPDALAVPAGGTIAALAGDDTVVGAGGDVILGNQGDDVITVGPGPNTVYGGMGDDTISAGDGDDLLFGDEGSDSITAGDGNDTVVGGQDSTDGADVIRTGSGDDLILGNGGNDTIAAGGGDDSVVGGYGDDVLLGNQGNDIVLGNQGDDLVYGGFGDDTLYGGQGDDVLYGNEGDDLLYGNEGSNTFVFAPGDTDFVSGRGTGDTIGDFKSGTDRIDFASGPAGTAGDFASATSTSTDFAEIEAVARSLLGGTVSYAFVADGADGFLFTTGGGGTTIQDAVKLVGAGTASSLRYGDIAHGAVA